MRETIIERVASGEGEVGDLHGLGGADGLRGEGTARGGLHQGDGIGAEHTDERGARGIQCSHRRGIVDTVGGRDTGGGEALRRDIGRGGRLREGIVRRVVADERQARNRRGLASRDRLIGEARRARGAHQRYQIAREHARQRGAREARRRRRRRIVDFVGHRHARHCQRRLRDVGRRCRLRESVVGRVAATERQAGDRHRLARGDCLVGKTRRAGAAHQRHRVAAHHAHQGGARETWRRRCVAVVGFVGRGHAAHRQGLHRDVGGGGRLGQRVVGCVASAQGQAAELNRLGRGHDLRRKGRRRHACIEVHGVARHHAEECGAAQRRGRGETAVVDLVAGAGTGDRQAFPVDHRRRRRWRERVVGRIRAAECQAGDRHRLGERGGLVGEARRA